MTDFVLGAAVGLVVGWVFFPEPAWFRDLWAKWFPVKNAGG